MNFHSNILEYLSLGIYENIDVNPLVLIENGKTIKLLDGMKLEEISVDGVILSPWATPCIHVIYKGGKEQYFEAYCECICL